MVSDKDIFIEDVFEIAFGDSAFQKGFSYEDVLNELRRFSDEALEAEEREEEE